MGGTVGRKLRNKRELPELNLKDPVTEGRDRVSVVINGHDVVRGWAETTTDAALGALFALAREYARIAIENDKMRVHLDVASKSRRDSENALDEAFASGIQTERDRWMALLDKKRGRK